jgi:alpha-L-rhamnosidase
MKRIIIVLLVFIGLIEIHAVAQPYWIGLPTSRDSANTWLCFRSEVNVSSITDLALATISADSKYWLYINGTMVLFEGGLKRGPSPASTYYDEVNLAPYLHKGNNTVAVLLWFFGKDGFAHKNSGKAGLYFNLTSDCGRLLSDDHWKIMQHPAYYTTQGKEEPNYRLAESNVAFDATSDMIDWTKPGFNDENWPKASLLGMPPTAPWGSLVKRPIPFFKNYGLKDYSSIRRSGDTLIAVLPYNCQFTPYLKIDASEKGKKIGMRTDNYAGGGENNFRAEYITRKGIQEYESFGWLNGHEMYYIIPSGIKVLGVKFRESGFDTKFAGSFSCNDSMFNTLWGKARRTLYITMRDNYMDCPDRERAQWIGDMVNEMGESFYALDTNSYSLARKSFNELIHWQKDDGTLIAPVPDGREIFELPMQILASIGWYGMYTYYLYSGDNSFIPLAYPAIQNYLKLWEVEPTGLVKVRKGSWSWGDWGENVDMEVLANAWYYLTLRAMKEYAPIAGHASDIPEIQARMDKLKVAFQNAFWNGMSYRSPSLKIDDDRALAMAIVSGLAPQENYEKLKTSLLARTWASPYMEKYVIEALFSMNYNKEAMNRMKERFQTMAESKITTLWEGWGIGKDGYGGGTYNHAWSGAPLTLLSQYYAGIMPLTPGYGTYQVCPHLIGPDRITATVPTVKGSIKVNINYSNDNKLFMDISGPMGTPIRLGVPEFLAKTMIVIDNRKLVPSEYASSKDASIQSLGIVNGYWMFEIRKNTATIRSY